MNTKSIYRQSTHRTKKAFAQEVNIPIKELNDEVIDFMEDRKEVYRVLTLMHENFCDLSKVTNQEIVAAGFVLAHYKYTVDSLAKLTKDIQRANEVNYDLETQEVIQQTNRLFSDDNDDREAPNQPKKKTKAQKQRERIEFEKTSTGSLIDLTFVPTSYEGIEVAKQKAIEDERADQAKRLQSQRESSQYPNLPQSYKDRVDYYFRLLETKVKAFEIVLDTNETKRAKNNLKALKDKTHDLLANPLTQPTDDPQQNTKAYQTYVMNVIAESNGLYDIEPEQFEELLDRIRECVKAHFGLLED